MKKINIIPTNDLYSHTEHSLCECCPKVEIEGGVMLIIHNSFDKREIVEQAIDIMNDKNK